MGIGKKVISIMVVIIAVGAALPVLWSTMVGTDTAIQALTETDDATTMLQALYPIALTLAGIAIVIGILFYAWKKLAG